ncbi:MAG: flavodoxin family protein [Anaerolineales bacterium]|jgi:flavodoxin
MKALVIYYSKFGNTQEVAEAVATVLQIQGSARLLRAEELHAEALGEQDLVVVGSPTHKMNLPEPMRLILKALPRRVLKGKAVAAFDTSYKMSAWLARFTAAHRLASGLRRLGGRLIVRPETFHVEAREGPLSEKEIERATGWAEGLVRALQEERSSAHLTLPDS